ncbi:MAG: hypothetical protein HY317_04025 [Acidobacteria bacterium]|nr:hypothetical protein [Acidobacteriota bacterium]
MRGRRALVGLFVLTLPLVTPRVRGADEIEHFAHLRSLVFDGDLDFSNEYARFYASDPQGLQAFKSTFLDLREPTTGRSINFAPVGSAILWSPFYLAAHAGVLAGRALGAAVPADGYAPPYVAAVAYASALYGFLGLLLVHDLLARRGGVPEPAATWTVAAVWLATPVLYYMTVAPAFAHANSLFTVGLVLWLAFRARETDRPADWGLVGLAGGLAGAVREQDLFFLVVPGAALAWDLVARRRTLGATLVRGTLLGAAAALAFGPQLLAYLVLNGRFGPSVLVARKMSWSSPHLLEALFDPGHGLFLWAPLLLVSAAGLVFAVKRRPEATLLLLLGLAAQAWINGSVESWHQAGAFGARRFVSATPVFAWGLAALVAAGLGRARAATAIGLALAVWWNVSLVVQFGLRLMDRQRLEWPRVAINQVTLVPQRAGRAAWLFFTDRERLVRESR